ncbi:2-oxo acid dehydrogenase subunit E2, partial [Photobacterium frigidiphilum]
MNSSQATDNLIDITMPSLGADMRDGTLIEWQIKPGDRVEKGDTIAVVETSKGAIEMEVYHSGTITELLITPDTKLPVGSVLARMTTTDAPVPSIPKPTAPMHSAPTPAPAPAPAASATRADRHDTIDSAAELHPAIGSNT